MQASGTFFFGSSTAPEFCAADSMPRKAHRVSEIDEPRPSERLRFFGFQAAPKVAPLNQNQPISDRPATGMITPQTVTEPILPVIDGPPKLAKVVSQISTITDMQVAMGVADTSGKNPAR